MGLTKKQLQHFEKRLQEERARAIKEGLARLAETSILERYS